MDVSVSGFRVEGSWDTVVRHAERVSRALVRVLAERGGDVGPRENQALGQWEEWRPRRDEVLEEEVADRTAEQASVGESEGEAEDVGVREDLADAGRKLNEATDNAREEGLGEAAESVGESVQRTTRAADQAARRALRTLEEGLYRHVVTSLSPYYFDNPLVSAALERVGEDAYVFEVNVKDDELKQAVADALEAMEEPADDRDGGP